MKLRYVILVLGIIFFNKINAESYRLSDDNKTIYVFEDCTINLEDLVPNNIYIYGNREYGGVGIHGKDLFKSRTDTLNKYIKGVRFARVNEIATIQIKYSQIANNSTVYLYKAIHTEEDEWCPNYKDTIKINIIKKSNSTISGDIKEEEPEVKPDNKAVTVPEEDVKGEDDNEKSEANFSLLNIAIVVLPFVVLVLVTVLINYILYRRNKKILNELSKKYLDLKEKVEQLDEDLKAKQNTSQKNKESILGSQDELKNFIKTYLLEFKQQQEGNSNTQGNETIGNTNVMVDSQKEKEQTIDTDDVRYNPKDNSFSLDQNDQKIFRIYSRNGDFYYTLVNDNEIRHELIGMIQIFEGCITYQTTNGEAKRVEPVNDGKLRRDGNKFYVDTNHKLTVKLV